MQRQYRFLRIHISGFCCFDHLQRRGGLIHLYLARASQCDEARFAMWSHSICNSTFDLMPCSQGLRRLQVCATNWQQQCYPCWFSHRPYTRIRVFAEDSSFVLFDLIKSTLLEASDSLNLLEHRGWMNHSLNDARSCREKTWLQNGIAANALRFFSNRRLEAHMCHRSSYWRPGKIWAGWQF